MGASGSLATSPPLPADLEKFQRVKLLLDNPSEGTSEVAVIAAMKAIFSPHAPATTPMNLSLKSPKAKGHQDKQQFFPSDPVKSPVPSQSPVPSPAAPTFTAEETEENSAMIADLKFMAGSGDWDSAFDLGVIYTSGSYGVPVDPTEAVKWWSKAAQHDVVDACFNLGHLYHHGNGVDRDLGKAKTYYEQAASLGNKDAASCIAALQPLLFAEQQAEKPRSISQDAPTDSADAAVEWYMAAADRGDTHAMFKLGNMYARGDMGLAIDFAKAGEWWATGAVEGHADALHNLLVHADDGVPADEIIGKMGGTKDWTRVETKLDEPLLKALPALQFLVSNLYRFGQGVERSEPECISYLAKAAARDLPDALYSLACLYDDGSFDDLKKDAAKVLELMQKAKDLKHQGAAIWVKRYANKKK